jgi:ATP-dependent helicase/nuclease subunit B
VARAYPVVVSPAAAVRLAAARDFVDTHAGTGVLVVGATRASADELAFAAIRDRGAIAGVARMSFAELAMRLALPALAERLVAPGGALGAEAIATRVAFDAHQSGELAYFAPVADLPGFPRAVARTLGELQLAGVDAAALRRVSRVGGDLATLLTRAEVEADRAGAVSRAEAIATAGRRLRATPAALPAAAVLLLDCAVTTAAERDLLAAVVEAAPDVLATVPPGDAPTRAAHAACGGVETAGRRGSSGDAPPSALDRLRTWLFSPEAPPEGERDDTVHVFSAPGEGREAVEIVRRVLDEARRGVPFDEMAVLLRAPQTYLGLLEHAFSRAGIPAWFERGTRRPDPAGRAFLALLACADEGLSARRFAEYLSLAQVPSAGTAPHLVAGSDPNGTDLVPASQVSTDEAVLATLPRDAQPEDPAPIDEAPPPDEHDPDGRVVAGTLRAPWRWEELLVEAYVIEGLDRWQRRLPGLRAEYERRIRELADEDHDSPRLLALGRDRDELGNLEAFALPIVAELDTWDEPRTWSAWLAAFEALVPRVLRQPARVQRVLAELAPLGSVGPVTLREVREVLAARLLSATNEPPRRRHGRVLVGTPQAARGRTFRVVFVPGLAERIFPQRLREDALLVDARRAELDAPLATTDARADDERLQLRLAVGAAVERLYLSYPRLELAESRPRVPSFYVLDVLRATSGAIPRYTAVSELAFRQGDAALDWPAPRSPEAAIDDLEHDLAVLRPMLRRPTAEQARDNGRARYLLELNPSLQRAMRERYARWQRGSHPADGLNRVVDLTRPALEQARLTARPYSLTSLQRFAICPYQFQLAAIYRLAPLEEPAPLQRLDPLTKGSLFHEIQTECLRRLQANGMLPVTEARLAAARQVLEWAIGSVTAKAEDDLVPAIERVWKDEIAALRLDLQGWLEGLVRDHLQWTPERFELAFGLPDDPNRDPASTAAPAVVGEQRFLLRGSIDLVERRRDGKALRVTDHKTGKNRTSIATVVEGGRVLQPVLYAVALEAVTGEPVDEGRLAYCTAAGGFTEHVIRLDPIIRRRGLEVLEIVDRAIEQGTLASRPGRMGAGDACDYCDFRPVCGNEEAVRTGRKPPLPDLEALRKFQ